MINRRGFLGAILAAGVAPAAVASGILMPVRALVLPRLVSTDEFGSTWLYPMEIGRIERFTFIETQYLPPGNHEDRLARLTLPQLKQKARSLRHLHAPRQGRWS